MAKKRSNYISNKELHAEFVEYHALVVEWEVYGDVGEPPPPIPRKIADGFIMIAEKYSSKFSNYYYYQEDLVSEAVLVCCSKAHKFDPNKTNNPFSYFTSVIHNAFLQSIKKEKKQKEVKKNYVKKMALEQPVIDGDEPVEVSHSQTYIDNFQRYYDDYESIEEKMLEENDSPNDDTDL